MSTVGGVPVRGSVKRNTAPPPGRLDAPIAPPWASTMPRQMASPNPMPRRGYITELSSLDDSVCVIAVGRLVGVAEIRADAD